MSDGLASGRWGSHWRWRAPLLLVTLALIGYGWVAADQWRTRMVVPGSRNPAVLMVDRRGGIALEAYDWKSKKRWHVTQLKDVHYQDPIANTLRIVGDGKGVAWHELFTLHVVDLAPPHEHRQYSTPALHTDNWFVGMTDDERYAVFQSHGERVPTADGGTEVKVQRTLGNKYPPVVVHRIVDLQTGEFLEMRAWDSSLTLTNLPDVFLSRRQGAKATLPDEPPAALWRIASDGTWEKIEDRDSRFVLGSIVSAAVDPRGHWRLLDDNEVVSPEEQTSQSRILRASSPGEQVLLFDMAERRELLLNTRSKEVLELANSYPLLGMGEFVDDGRAMIWTDLRDDVHLIDTRTGKFQTLDGSGSQRRNRLLVVVASLLLVSAILLGTALGERHLFWTLADVMASFVAAQMAVSYLLVSVIHPELHSLVFYARYGLLSIGCYLLGMFVGAAAMVGIYWAFGRGSIFFRWLLGGLCLFVVALPLAVVATQFAESDNSLMVVFAVTMAFGLLFSGATSGLGLLVRAMGWTLRDGPVEENLRQYRLATFFLMVAAVAVLIAVGQWLFAGPNVTQTLSYLLAGIAIVASGMILAGILLSDAKAWLVALAAALFILVPMTAIYLHGEYPMGPMSRYEIYILDGPAALAATVTIAIPCLVLRARGWRWRRGKKGEI
jgi:MFS family permease